jgi:hypothetical protein
MKQNITVIPEKITYDQAFTIVQSVSSHFSPQIQKKVYYPYFWVHFEYEVKTILGKRNIQAYCLVDMLENQASTADHFDPVETEAEEENILIPQISTDLALKTAQTYLVHSAIHTMKALLYPRSTVINKVHLHKPFWIVRCDNRQGERFRVIVDGLTGKFQILNIEDKDES